MENLIKNSILRINSVFNRFNKKLKLSYFDDIFFDYKNPKKKLIDLVKKNDLIIYNYSSKKTINTILSLSKKFKKKLINISLKKINFRNNQNFINLFNN